MEEYLRDKSNDDRMNILDSVKYFSEIKRFYQRKNGRVYTYFYKI